LQPVVTEQSESSSFVRLLIAGDLLVVRIGR